MAKLYFRYGVMGSSKTANALMVGYNYSERNQNALVVKPILDSRDGEHTIKSRIGLSHDCMFFHEINEAEISEYACIIVDEAQFLSKIDVQKLVHFVDDFDVPVICYGLRTDFKGELFEGSAELLAVADVIEEIKTVCWCGKKATFTARFDEDGNVLKNGEQIVMGANDKYIGLCRKHWNEGNLGRK